MWIRKHRKLYAFFVNFFWVFLMHCSYNFFAKNWISFVNSILNWINLPFTILSFVKLQNFLFTDSYFFCQDAMMQVHKMAWLGWCGNGGGQAPSAPMTANGCQGVLMSLSGLSTAGAWCRSMALYASLTMNGFLYKLAKLLLSIFLFKIVFF